MRKALLDTDILSEIAKAKDPHVRRHARDYLASHGQFTFSSISVMEVIAGFAKQQADQKGRLFVEMAYQSDVLPLDLAAADLAGRIFADLQRAGRPIGVPDTMIAAIAIHHGLPLATGNTSDYARVQEAGYPLVLQNWRDPS